MAPFPGHFHDGVLRCDFAAQMMVDTRLQCSSTTPDADFALSYD
jgi:hypothetical protein